MKYKKIRKACIFLFIILIIGIILYFRYEYNNINLDNPKVENVQGSSEVANVTDEDGFTEKELDDMEYVDQKIQKLLLDKSYKELSLENQVLKVEELLKNLKNQGYIKNFTYDNGASFFNFEYACGVYGGVMMKEFDPMFNK